jgi:hypothetical protein
MSLRSVLESGYFGGHATVSRCCGMTRVSTSKSSAGCANSPSPGLLLDSEYLDVLKRGRFLVQVSFSTMDDALAETIEIGVPSPTARLEMLGELAQIGIPTTCRLQPLLPTREHEAEDLAGLCQAAGVRHFAVEHLKLPLERSPRIERLSDSLRFDLRKFYRDRAARRVGREWILPVEDRIQLVSQLRNHCHEIGLSFGAADNDLLPMSDGSACCAGVDTIWSDVKSFEHNYLGAVRSRDRCSTISHSALNDVWCPTRPAGNVVNSRSRLRSVAGTKPGLRDYIDANWNGRANGNSPLAFAGVAKTGRTDDDGFEIYELEPRWAAIYKTQRPSQVRLPTNDASSIDSVGNAALSLARSRTHVDPAV